MASRIKKKGWITLGVVAVVIDVIQMILGWIGTLGVETVILVILVAINDVADPFIGGTLLVYLQLRGISMIQKPKRLISILGVTGLDEFTGGIASFWIADVWYLYSDVMKDEAMEKAQKEAQKQWEEQSKIMPQVQGGIAMSLNQMTGGAPDLGNKNYHDGVGRPRGNGSDAKPTNIVNVDFKPKKSIDGIQKAA